MAAAITIIKITQTSFFIIRPSIKCLLVLLFYFIMDTDAIFSDERYDLLDEMHILFKDFNGLHLSSEYNFIYVAVSYVLKLT